jgi:hypothetical protein
METTDPTEDCLQQLTWIGMAISRSDRQGSGRVSCCLSGIALAKLTVLSPPMSFLRSLPPAHMWPSRGFRYVILLKRHNAWQTSKPAQSQQDRNQKTAFAGAIRSACSLCFDWVVCYKAHLSGARTPRTEEDCRAASD